jgi:hypothetical protein
LLLEKNTPTLRVEQMDLASVFSLVAKNVKIGEVIKKANETERTKKLFFFRKSAVHGITHAAAIMAGAAYDNHIPTNMTPPGQPRPRRRRE